MPKWLKIILALLALFAAIILVLFIISKVAGFNTLGDMMYHIMDYLKYIWEDRITG